MSPMPTSGHSVLTVEMVQYFPLRSIGAVPAHSARMWSIASANMSLRSASSSPSADGQDEPAFEQIVEHRRVRGHDHGMAVRKIDHGGPDFHLRGRAQQRGDKHHAVGNVLGRVGEVLAAIAFAVSEPVGENKGFP